MKLFEKPTDTGSKKTSQDLRPQIISALCVLFLVIDLSDAAGCSKRFTKQVIKYKDCIPKGILTRACVGTCVTNAHVSESYPFRITHSCYQCKEATTKTRKVKIVCPNPQGPVAFRNEIITIAVPQDCQCEPCTFDNIVSIAQPKNKK